MKRLLWIFALSACSMHPADAPTAQATSPIASPGAARTPKPPKARLTPDFGRESLWDTGSTDLPSVQAALQTSTQTCSVTETWSGQTYDWRILECADQEGTRRRFHAAFRERQQPWKVLAARENFECRPRHCTYETFRDPHEIKLHNRAMLAWTWRSWRRKPEVEVIETCEDDGSCFHHETGHTFDTTKTTEHDLFYDPELLRMFTVPRTSQTMSYAIWEGRSELHGSDADAYLDPPNNQLRLRGDGELRRAAAMYQDGHVVLTSTHTHVKGGKRMAARPQTPRRVVWSPISW